jgi:hypothetical protein
MAESTEHYRRSSAGWKREAEMIADQRLSIRAVACFDLAERLIEAGADPEEIRNALCAVRGYTLFVIAGKRGWDELLSDSIAAAEKRLGIS